MFNSNWDPLCLAIGFSKRNIIVRTSGGKIYIRRKIHAMKVDHGRTLPLCMCTQIWLQKISVQLEVRSSVSSFLLFVFFYIFPFYLPQPDILFFSKPSIIVHTFFGKKKIYLLYSIVWNCPQGCGCKCHSINTFQHYHLGNIHYYLLRKKN